MDTYCLIQPHTTRMPPRARDLFVVLHFIFYYYEKHGNRWLLYLATEMERPPVPTTVSWHTFTLGPKFRGTKGEDFDEDLLRNDNDNELCCMHTWLFIHEPELKPCFLPLQSGEVRTEAEGIATPS